MPIDVQGGLGPMQGQAHHFVRYAPETFEYARDHFVSETKRHYGVLENRLEQSNWLAAGQYTIADIACYCWVWIGFWGAIDVSEFPKVQVYKSPSPWIMYYIIQEWGFFCSL